MKNMERNISKLVNRFIKESFVDITDMDPDKAVEEVTEKAHGKDKKFGDGRDRIDVAEPKGEITGADFRKLQSMKKKKQTSPAGFEPVELVAEEGETEEGNKFSGALDKAREEGKDTFTVDGKKYNVTKESVNKKIERILERRRGRLDEKWKGDVEVEKTGEYSDMSIEDLNSAIKKQKAKNDKTKESGKKVS